MHHTKSTPWRPPPLFLRYIVGKYLCNRLKINKLWISFCFINVRLYFKTTKKSIIYLKNTILLTIYQYIIIESYDIKEKTKALYKLTSNLSK